MSSSYESRLEEGTDRRRHVNNTSSSRDSTAMLAAALASLTSATNSSSRAAHHENTHKKPWYGEKRNLAILAALAATSIAIGLGLGMGLKQQNQAAAVSMDPCPERRVLLTEKKDELTDHADRSLTAVETVSRRRLLRNILSGETAEGKRGLRSDPWESKTSKTSKTSKSESKDEWWAGGKDSGKEEEEEDVSSTDSVSSFPLSYCMITELTPLLYSAVFLRDT